MKRDRDTQQLNGLIDRGCTLEGKLTFDGAVQINGNFQGEILSDGTLVVGNEAQIEGRINVHAVIVEGNISGTIEAKGRIEMRRGSRVVAEVATPSFVIDEGAIFHGQCRMLEEGCEGIAGQPTEGDGVFLQEGDDSLMM